jgi:hypothetical protein
VPYPVDYGGVFDLFYKIKTLHRHGILIHLHCFEYGRGEQAELSKYCVEVRYYSRNQGHKGFSHKLPYIVCSRSNAALPENLSKDDYPIILEGIHCTHLLSDPRFADRKIILRLHNVECLYYRQLFHSTHSLFRKIYYYHESKILKRYEKSIANKVLIATVAEQDASFYRDEFGARNIICLPVFLPFIKVTSKTGTGCYCLYHGNLSITENEEAACWLLENVFRDLSFPFVIAGKNPSPRLEKMIQHHQQGCLVANPTEAEMQDIISKAQVHLLPSFNCTGIKLKLLNALFNGRHCIVNQEAVKDTGLEDICHLASTGEAFRKTLSEIYHQPFSLEDIGLREKTLESLYDNDRGAKQLIQYLS